MFNRYLAWLTNEYNREEQSSVSTKIEPIRKAHIEHLLLRYFLKSKKKDKYIFLELQQYSLFTLSVNLHTIWMSDYLGKQFEC